MKSLSVSYAVFAFSSVTSATYANWFGFRGAQINNTIVLEGGVLQTGNFSNGSWGKTTQIVNTNGGGIYRQLDLTKSFKAGTDADALLIAKSETNDVNAPGYINGAMFHNERSWWTFAGQRDKINNYTTSQNSVVRGTVWGAQAGAIAPLGGWQQSDGASGVYQNVAAGLYASSGDPGQKLGWFLGGMRNTNNSVLRYPLPSTTPIEAFDAFYQADMSDDYTIKMAAIQSPGGFGQVNGYVARAEGALVWLPFGKSGVLIAFGGVQYPADLTSTKSSTQTTNNTYMSDLLIYDIANGKWYSQSTIERGVKPSQLAAFCTAVVSSQDGNSQHVVVYGGYSGTSDLTRPANDDVWILSIPAFQWTRVIESKDTTHGRKSPLCFAPNPSTFISIGGAGLSQGPLGSDTFIDVLNLNNMSWGNTYDPSSTENFSAPAPMVTQLGWPDAKGPGSRVVGNINNQDVSNLFNTTYPTAIQTLYPYAAASSTTSSSPGPTTSAAASGSGPNIALIASLATVLPLLAIAAIIAFFCIRRRNKRGVKRTQDNRSTVSSWLGRSSTIDPRGEKSQADTEETIINSPDDHFYTSPVVPAVQRKGDDIYEADPHSTATPSARSPGPTSTAIGNHEYFEIMDHPPRGAAALAAHKNNPVGGSELGSNKPASELPHASSRENLSVPSGGVIAGASQPSPISRKPVADRRESTPLPSPSTPNMGHTRGTSDVSSAVLTASPNTDFRRSQHIDSLPDHPGLGEGRATPTMQGRSSAYKEKFDDQ